MYDRLTTANHWMEFQMAKQQNQNEQLTFKPNCESIEMEEKFQNYDVNVSWYRIYATRFPEAATI